jgi:hypothetical protein
MDARKHRGIQSSVQIIRTAQRILFLESIAGVPGMVAATLRHLQSLRLMVRSFSIYQFKYPED